MQLDSSRIKAQKDLANTFIKHYYYNLDITLTKIDLQNMVKKSIEMFKEHAQRLMSRVLKWNLLFINLKLVTTFINTLKSLYYEFLIKNSTNNFIDLIITREHIDKCMKKRKILTFW